ncbi:MAG: HprK-related kinase A [Sedimenticola sp.]|nr:HprK-related kinase A [Sedimenticola sp.]
MTRLNQISYDNFEDAIRSSGIRLRTGPFTTNLSTKLRDVIHNLYLLYADHTVSIEPGFSDFHLKIHQPSFFRRWYHPQVNFSFDGLTPFNPLPRPQAYAIFEWGLNWCISNYSHQYLMLHSAVLEKNGHAVIFPGAPGAGKSTLCAALSLSEWRLFSDEVALIEPVSNNLVSNPRPISLKNKSIEIIKAFSGEAIIGKTIYDTSKGTIAHMQPPVESVHRSNEKAKPKIIAFPKFIPGAKKSLIPLTKGEAFIKLCENAFNYSTLGLKGFDMMSELIDQCDCYQFEYSDLNDAIDTFNSIVPQKPL